jgi:2,3-bisphosphoglycerate-independent phosphoglycerate mutase
MIMFLGVMTVSAQSDDVSDRREGHKQKRELRKEFNESLSEDQKAQLEYQKQLRTEHKETWKATYTEEQLAIVQNEDLSRKGKHKALKSTLSDAQKEMKKSQKEKMKAEKSKFEASLSNEQLKKYSEIIEVGLAIGIKTAKLLSPPVV